MVYALFVLMSTPLEKKKWVYSGQSDSHHDIALFVRNVESDIELTKDLAVKTVMYKIVDLS